MNCISANVKTIRKRWKASQADLGKLLHVSRNVVMNWERGRSVPGFAMLQLLSSLTGIPDIVSQEIPMAAVPAQPLSGVIDTDYIARRLDQIEALLTENANK